MFRAGDFAGDFLGSFAAVSGNRLGLVFHAPRLTRAMRAHQCQCGPQPPCGEILSGHTLMGKPTRRAHVAYVPLADVGHEPRRRTSSGHSGGPAPRAFPRLNLNECVRRLPGPASDLGRIGTWDLEGRRGLTAKAGRLEMPRHGLAPSQRWASGHALVLDRFPRKDRDAGKSRSPTCERVGLPRPVAG